MRAWSGAARAGVAGGLIGARSHRAAGQELPVRLGVGDSGDRALAAGWTKGLLHHAVGETLERDDGEGSAGGKDAGRGAEAALERTEFVVDGETKRLESLGEKERAMRRHVSALTLLVLVAMMAASLVMPAPASAVLLVYEPFDYGDTWLNGNGGALGTTGAWTSTLRSVRVREPRWCLGLTSARSTCARTRITGHRPGCRSRAVAMGSRLCMPETCHDCRPGEYATSPGR